MKVAVGVIDYSGFDWDEANVHKVHRHKVETFIVEEFFTRKLLYFPDKKHSQYEDRYLAYGTTFEGRPLIVAFTMRNKNGENNFESSLHVICIRRK